MKKTSLKKLIYYKIERLGYNARNYIFIDTEAYKELLQEMNVKECRTLYGKRLILVNDLDSPMGKEKFIIGGTKWR